MSASDLIPNMPDFKNVSAPVKIAIEKFIFVIVRYLFLNSETQGYIRCRNKSKEFS